MIRFGCGSLLITLLSLFVSRGLGEEPAKDSVDESEPRQADGVGAVGGGAVPPKIVVLTRPEFVPMMKRNEQLRADIRVTNPKLQLIIDGKFEEFEKLLDEEPRLATVRWGYYAERIRPLNPFHAPPRHGPTALQLSAEHGCLRLVKRLAKAEIVNLSDPNRETPLGVAANVEIAEVLVEAGAKVDGSPEFYPGLPLSSVAKRGKLELCKWLFDRGHKKWFDAKEFYPYSNPVVAASMAGHVDVVR